jgi:hypothetical protein
MSTRSEDPFMRPIRAALLTFVVVPWLTLAACSAYRTEPGPLPDTPPRETSSWPASAASGVAPQQGAVLPYLVRKGWLELEVAEPPATAARAQTMTARLGGTTQNATVGETRARLVLRVPEPRLDEALDSLSTLGKVESRRLSADDVTEEVIDLEARVASLSGVRDRLRALLDGASAMSEIMSIERELTRVQAEIDAIEGRLRHLRSRATMAELSLAAHRERKLGPIGAIFAGLGWTLSRLFVYQ